MHFGSISLVPLVLSAAYGQTLQTVLSTNTELSTFSQLLEGFPNFLTSLNPGRNVTILAPSNSAFDSIDVGGLSSNELGALLRYHVLNGRYATSGIETQGSFIPTFLREEAWAAVSHGQVVYAVRTPNNDSEAEVSFYSGYNNQSTITQPDIEFDFGLIHIISNPLTIPPTLRAITLAADLIAFNRLGNDSGYSLNNLDSSDTTFFAPTDEAFLQMWDAFDSISNPAVLYLYHYINDTTPIYTSRIDHADWITALRRNVTFTIEDDGSSWVNNARIVQANILVSNGVVHVIDQVLNPNNTEAPAPTGQVSGTAAFGVEPVETMALTSVQFTDRLTPTLAPGPTVTPTWHPDQFNGLASESEPGNETSEDTTEGGQGASEGQEQDGAAPSLGTSMSALLALGMVAVIFAL